MCGIFGFVLDTNRALDEAALIARMDTLQHRGPDGSGYWLGTTADEKFQVGFGHRRLSIIDIAGGAQPMWSADGAVVVIFNGEIYNFIELREELRALGHSFRSDSDTEVLIESYRRWGNDAVLRFRGMFAFALFDLRRQRVLLARDHFGKKPLFFAQRGSDLQFGSEIGCLLDAPGVDRQLDWDALEQLLIDRYVLGPATLFRSIRKLPAGCIGVWEQGSFKIESYFTPPVAMSAPNNSSFPDAVRQFGDVFDEAVRIRMRSDAPYGAYLSGGIDSSAVVATMSRHSSAPVKTFSVGFEEEAYSELGHARTIAAKFETDHQELIVTPENYMNAWPDALRHRGAPVSEPADIPILLLSRAARSSVKMVLTGEGADEFLAGYPKHRAESWVSSYHRLVPKPIHDRLLKPLIDALPYGMRRAKILARSLSERDLHRRVRAWFGGLSFAERANILGRHPISDLKLFPFLPQGVSPLRQVLFFDQRYWLPDNLLERGDRMMMAGSIEGRMPFMDVELARLAATFPDRFLVAHARGKGVLRAAIRSILPSQIIERKKVGFRIPIDQWFRGPFRDRLLDLLSGSQSEIRRILNRAAVDRYVTEHLSGQNNHQQVLWMLANLELFIRTFRPNLGGIPR